MESTDNLADQSKEGSVCVEGDRSELSNRDRLPYYKHQLQFDRSLLPAFMADISDDELRVLFEQMLDATDLCSSGDFPLPCSGLPGFLHNEYDQFDEAGEIISIGLEYLGAVVHNQRRTMHLRWRDAREKIRDIRQKVRQELEDELFAVRVQQGREEQAASLAAAQAQLVYFIGAASGPIKIGIAVSPQNRLKGLQTGHHERLELLATCEGGQAREQAYHKQFKARRLNGEWFERCPEIEAEIERLSE